MSQTTLFDTAPEVIPKLPGYPCVFSRCEQYRYTLYRVWNVSEHPRLVMFLLLNPSTATAEVDDPTIRRCCGYARAWGFDGLCVCNLFAFRATDPAIMLSRTDPTGDDNDLYIVQCADVCELIVCGWGEHGLHQRRSTAVRVLLSDKKLHYLALNKSGECAHPLYLPANLQPVEWRRERVLDAITTTPDSE